MLWIKAFHIIAVVTWFAGLFYLPRLFVYHADASDQISRERFQIMERRLYRAIMTPSAAIAIVLGLILTGYNPSYYFVSGWFYIKLLLVIALFIYHIICGRYLKRFAAEQPVPSSRFFRWFNEVPSVILVVVVILVEVQPF